MDVDQVNGAGLSHAAVLAVLGAAVADEVLGRRNGVGVVLERALHAFDVFARVAAHDFRMLGIAFIGAAPAIVAHDGQRRAEHPGDTGRAHGFRGGGADLAHQLRIARCAQSDIVREQRSARHVVVAMDRVGPPHDRHLDRHVGLHRRVVVRLRQCQPFLRARRLVPVRPAAAAIEHRAQIIFGHVGRRGGLDLGLRHLADLLGQRHLADDLLDALLERGVLLDRAGHARPVGQVGVDRGGMREGRQGKGDRKGEQGRAKRGCHGLSRSLSL